MYAVIWMVKDPEHCNIVTYTDHFEMIETYPEAKARYEEVVDGGAECAGIARCIEATDAPWLAEEEIIADFVYKVGARRVVPVKADKHAGCKAVLVVSAGGWRTWGFGEDWQKAEIDAVNRLQRLREKSGAV